MKTPPPDKPPFVPLTLAAVNGAPPNGLTHVSTFSGGGGTCLGFRLAGYRTLWASDIDSHARASYAANLGSEPDGRDIRHLTAEDILQATGLKAGELDVFEGSPPCTAFSTAGKRAKGWGQRKEHAGVVQANVEDLFFEWLRLLEGLRPRAFVAENVAGMVKGVAKGYFKDVLRRMKAAGYRTEARLVDAQWLGVPQQRLRVIFVGVREDVGVAPAFPVPLPWRYSVREAIPWIGGLTVRGYSHDGEQVKDVTDRPMVTVSASPNGTGLNRSGSKIDLVAPSRRVPGAFNYQDVEPDRPCPTVTIGSPGNDLGVPVALKCANGLNGHAPRKTLDEPAETMQAGRPVRVVYDTGGFVRGEDVTDRPAPCVQIGGPSAICRTHYLVEGAGVGSGDTKTGRTAGGAASVDRRKFTIAELRRICSFPDDYAMDGSYAQQWARLGNSVPPLMAHAIAAALRDALLGAGRG